VNSANSALDDDRNSTFLKTRWCTLSYVNSASSWKLINVWSYPNFERARSIGRRLKMRAITYGELSPYAPDMVVVDRSRSVGQKCIPGVVQGLKGMT
jgi:hypothetical protein